MFLYRLNSLYPKLSPANTISTARACLTIRECRHQQPTAAYTTRSAKHRNHIGRQYCFRVMFIGHRKGTGQSVIVGFSRWPVVQRERAYKNRSCLSTLQLSTLSSRSHIRNQPRSVMQKFVDKIKAKREARKERKRLMKEAKQALINMEACKSPVSLLANRP